MGVHNAALTLVKTVRSSDPDLLRRILADSVLTPRQITLRLNPATLARSLGVHQDHLAPVLPYISAPVSLRRLGVEARLVIGAPIPQPDPVLLKALFDAHRWAKALRDGAALNEVARDAGHHDA